MQMPMGVVPQSIVITEGALGANAPEEIFLISSVPRFTAQTKLILCSLDIFSRSSL